MNKETPGFTECQRGLLRSLQWERGTGARQRQPRTASRTGLRLVTVVTDGWCGLPAHGLRSSRAAICSHRGSARRESGHQVIRAALVAMKRDERLSIAAAEARVNKDELQDRAKIAAIHEDLAALQQTRRWVRSIGLPARGKGPRAAGPPVCRGAAAGLAHLEHLGRRLHLHQRSRDQIRPAVDIVERRTLVICDQIAIVDLTRLAEPVGLLTLEEMQRVDEALSVVLDRQM